MSKKLSDKQILKKAIKQARQNGYKGLHFQYEKTGIPFGVVLQDTMKIIFDHGFAKSFFGEEWDDGDAMLVPMSEILAQENIEKWQHHLRQMVLKKNKLKYIAKFL